MSLAIVGVLHAFILVVLSAGLAHESPERPPKPIEVRLIEQLPPTDALPPPPMVRIDSPPVDVLPPSIPLFAEATSATTAITVAPAAPVAPPPTPPVPETLPRFDADYLSNPAPVYPATSRRLREEGTVLLRVRVTAEGQAARVLIERTSGSARLDRAALEAVERWRFVPARRGSKPVEAWVLVPIEFALKS